MKHYPAGLYQSNPISSKKNWTKKSKKTHGMGNEMRIAMLSYHTCPLATLGGKDTGGMNVYVRDLTIQLGAMGVQV
ncbi:MAG: hypothetical protein ABFD53_02195, partial [Anaerolineaceae bacterium]